MKLIKVLVAALALLTVVVAPVFATSKATLSYVEYNGVRVPYELAVRLGMVKENKTQTEAEKCAAKDAAHKLFMAPYELAVKAAEEEVKTYKANAEFAAKLTNILTVFNNKKDRDAALNQLVQKLQENVNGLVTGNAYLPSDIAWVKSLNTEIGKAAYQHELLTVVVAEFLRAEKAGLPVLDLKGHAEALKASSDALAALNKTHATVSKHAAQRAGVVFKALAMKDEKLTKEQIEKLVEELVMDYAMAVKELQMAKDMRDLMALNYPGCTVPPVKNVTNKTNSTSGSSKRLPATGVR